MAGYLQDEDKLVLCVDALQHGAKSAPYPTWRERANDQSPSANWRRLACAVGYFLRDPDVTAYFDGLLARKDSYREGEANTDDGHSVLGLVGDLFALSTARERGDAKREALLGEHVRQWIAQQLLGANKPNDLAHARFVGAGQRWVGPKESSWRVEYLIRRGLGMTHAEVAATESGMSGAGLGSAQNQSPFCLQRFLDANGGAVALVWREQVAQVVAALRAFGWRGMAERCLLRGTRADYTYIRFADGSYLSAQDGKHGIPPTRFLVWYDAPGKLLVQFPDYPEPRSDSGEGGSDVDLRSRSARAWDKDAGTTAFVQFKGKAIDVVIEQGPGGIVCSEPDKAPEPAPSPAPDPPLVTGGQGRTHRGGCSLGIFLAVGLLAAALAWAAF